MSQYTTAMIDGASTLEWMRNVTVELSPPALGLRRPTLKERGHGLPTSYWVKDIVRPNGRKDKEFFSQTGMKFRSIKQAVQAFDALFVRA